MDVLEKHESWLSDRRKIVLVEFGKEFRIRAHLISKGFGLCLYFRESEPRLGPDSSTHSPLRSHPLL